MGSTGRSTSRPMASRPASPSARATAATRARSPASMAARRTVASGTPGGLGHGVGHHAFEGALAQLADEQAADEVGLGRGGPAEQVAEQARAAGAPTLPLSAWSAVMAASSSSISIDGLGGGRRVDGPEGGPARRRSCPAGAGRRGRQTAGSTSSGSSRRSRSARAAILAERARVEATASDVRTTSASSIRPTVGGGGILGPCAVLFTTTPGWGHIHPMVPLARAFVERGDEVAWARDGRGGPPGWRAEGFTVHPAGQPARREFRRGHAPVPGNPGPPPDSASLTPSSPTSSEQCSAPAMLADLLPVARGVRAGCCSCATRPNWPARSCRRPGRPQCHPLVRGTDPRHRLEGSGAGRRPRSGRPTASTPAPTPVPTTICTSTSTRRA